MVEVGPSYHGSTASILTRTQLLFSWYVAGQAALLLSLSPPRPTPDDLEISLSSIFAYRFPGSLTNPAWLSGQREGVYDILFQVEASAQYY